MRSHTQLHFRTSTQHTESCWKWRCKRHGCERTETSLYGYASVGRC